MLNSLSVPVVDLVDVPEDNFVLSFHVVGDALLLDPFHEALRRRVVVTINDASNPSTLIIFYTELRSTCFQLQASIILCFVWFSYLHHDAQVFDVVFLCLNQLLQNKPEQRNTTETPWSPWTLVVTG